MAVDKEISLKEKILQSSRNRFISEGYRNLSLRKIAADIGVSATSIYLHFESKDHLIHTLMEQSIEKLKRALSEEAKHVRDPVKRLEVLARTYVNFALQNPQEYQIIYLDDTEEMSRYPKEKFRQARKGYEVLTETIEEGVAAGLMEEEHPRLAAYIFWAQLHGILSVVLSKRLDNRIDREVFIEQAIQHTLDGLHVRSVIGKI